MTSLLRLFAGLVFAAGCTTAALAQLPPGLPNPDLQNRIPAPLPPPAPPPVINGPLGQSPPPGVYLPPRLKTFSDRAAACLQEGSSFGLHGRRLDRYTRACVNAN
jgi:hypothetical protein